MWMAKLVGVASVLNAVKKVVGPHAMNLKS